MPRNLPTLILAACVLAAGGCVFTEEILPATNQGADQLGYGAKGRGGCLPSVAVCPGSFYDVSGIDNPISSDCVLGEPLSRSGVLRADQVLHYEATAPADSELEALNSLGDRLIALRIGSSAKLSDNGLLSVSRNSSLRSLSVGYLPKVTPEGLKRAILGLPIQHLALELGAFSNGQFDVIPQCSASLAGLKWLALKGAGTWNCKWDQLVNGCRDLLELRVSGFSADQYKRRKPTEDKARLHRLSLDNCRGLLSTLLSGIARGSLHSLRIVGESDIEIDRLKDLMRRQDNLQEFDISSSYGLVQSCADVLCQFTKLRSFTARSVANDEILLALPGLDSLRVLDCSSSRDVTPDGLGVLGKLRLTEVILDDVPHVSDQTLNDLSESGPLKALSARRCQAITSRGITSLISKHELDSVVLDGCAGVDDELWNCSEGLGDVTRLSLAGCPCTQSIKPSFFSKLDNIADLDLGRTSIVGDEALRSISNRKTLRKLRLGKVKISGATGGTFEALDQLSVLGLKGIERSRPDDSPVLLAPAIVRLELYGSVATADLIPLLASPRLEEIRLTLATSEVMKDLVSAMKGRRLREIDLVVCDVDAVTKVLEGKLQADGVLVFGCAGVTHRLLEQISERSGTFRWVGFVACPDVTGSSLHSLNMRDKASVVLRSNSE